MCTKHSVQPFNKYIGSDLKKRIWNEEGPDINGMIFRLHYKVILRIILAFWGEKKYFLFEVHIFSAYDKTY